MPKNKYTAEYEEFWKSWPGRWNAQTDKITKVGKWDAFEVWQKIPQEERKVIVEIVKSGKFKFASRQYLPDAFRWLKRRRWDDFR